MSRPFTQINLEDVAHLRGLGASSILVYLALRIYGGKDSRAWPSQERIAMDLNMPIPTVRKAFRSLRDKGIIKEDKSAKSKTKTYELFDISNMVCQKKEEDIQSDIPTDQKGYLDISNQISRHIKSDIQIHKIKEKEEIRLIDNYNLEPKFIDSSIAKKGDPNGSLEIDDLSLLFAELWNKHSMSWGMLAQNGNPLEEWKEISKGHKRYTIIRSLKSLDFNMSKAHTPWNKMRGGGWKVTIKNWIARQRYHGPLTKKEEIDYAQCIHVGPDKINQLLAERMKQEEEDERHQAMMLDESNNARRIWRAFHEDQNQRGVPEEERWPDLCELVLNWKKTFLTPDLKKEIYADPQLSNFKLILSI
tara:strand:- start:413 stop:1495 length:1083 start_codon:yes stop_codon:yes gene_type:complete